MRKNYLLVLSLLFFCVATFAQTIIKKDKKKPAESPKTGQEIVYAIDGVIANSPIEFFRLKSENILSITIVNDPSVIATKYPRKGELYKSVIVVQTNKSYVPEQTVKTDISGQTRVKMN
jgi:hypothetical protein